MTDNKMGVNCPGCGVEITTSNAGGYRTYCEGCVISGEDYTLFVDDCINVMSRMADNITNLTVTSPPYDNLRDYGKSFDADTFDWKPIIKELYRVTVVGGVVVWVVADATINGSETGTSFKQALWAMECGFRLHDTMIYQRQGAFPDSNRYHQNFEYMFIFSKSFPKTVNLIKDRKNKHAGKKKTSTDRQKNGTLKKFDKSYFYADYGLRSNIWRYKNGYCGNDIKHNHPATFPEALANDHIISWSNPGDMVFDPFLGSGTTGKMAIRNGRKFIGCDIEPSYVDLAYQRIANQAGDYTTTDREKASGQVALWDLIGD